MPDTLVGRAVRLYGEVASDVAEAEMANARFDAEASPLVDTEALARLLLRAEAAQVLGETVTDVTVLEVSNAQAVGQSGG